MSNTRAVILVLGLLWVTACGRKQTVADLNSFYARAAQYHDRNRNPIIVIPGVLGSKLIEPQSSQVVWGAFGPDAANPEDPEGARLFSLPLSDGRTPFKSMVDNVVPGGVLETMEIKILGLPIRLRAYINILLTLGAGGYVDETLPLSRVDYGSDHFTCFQFDYDWRRDLVETAADLHRFIEEKHRYLQDEYTKRYGPGPHEIKFDIVAHSMGGLIARYYAMYGHGQLEEVLDREVVWRGAERIDKLVLIGTPNAGSMESMLTLLEGEQFSLILPSYDPVLIGSFPSVYQMLPRTRHRVLVDKATGSFLDILDPKLWIEQGWGLAHPDKHDLVSLMAPEGAQKDIAHRHLEQALTRAALFQRAMDRPVKAPAPFSLYLVIGDAVDTAAVMEVDRQARSYRISERRPGDGRVLRSSVLLDERAGGHWQPQLVSPLQIRNALFLNTDHLAMTKDPTFADNILFYLLEAPRSISQ